MKKIPSRDIIFGVNDTSHFVHKANKLKDNSNLSLKDFFLQTEEKRRWSIINPGFLLSNAYIYFVFGHENEVLIDFPFNDFLSQINIITDNHKNYSDDIEKGKYLQKRLRNSLAHCRYDIEIRTESGEIEKDGDIWFVFEDRNQNGNNLIRFEMSLPTFGNLIEKAGAHTMKKMK